MLALGEICCEGMESVEKGVEVWALCEICFEGIGGVKREVRGVGIG